MSGGVGGTSYRFLWRSRVVVTRLDAEGVPTYEQIDSVSFTDFALVAVADLTFLRIENPSRNVRDLLNALETLVGMGFTVKPVVFDKGQPSTVFRSVDASKLVGLKVVGAVVADDLVARMRVRRGARLSTSGGQVRRQMWPPADPRAMLQAAPCHQEADSIPDPSMP